MWRWVLVVFLAPLVLFGGCLGAVITVGAVASGNVPTMPDATPSSAAADIPPVALKAYQDAAPICPGLSWTILAGIGWKETGHGTANGHHLDDSGQTVPADPPLHSNVNNGALGYAWGPMQFLASTWATYGPQVAPGLDNSDMVRGPVQNVRYAAAAAARLLCGRAGGSITDPTTLAKAIDAYSGSTDGYVDAVTTMAALYGVSTASTPSRPPAAPPTSNADPAPPSATPPSGSGLRITLAALHFVGIPYANGDPRRGDPGIQYSGHPGDVWVEQHFGLEDARYATLDCSGLVNATMYLAYGLRLNHCSADYLHDPRFRHVSMSEIEMGDIVTRGGCGPTGHIAIVAYVDPTTGLASIVDAARHGTVVGFRAQQDPRSWGFTDAVRYAG